MDQNDKHIPVKYRGKRITTGVVVTVVAVLVLVLLLLVLMKTGVILPPAFLQSVFGSGDSAEPDSGTVQSVIPDFSADSVLAGEHYHTFPVDPRETLAVLNEADAYVREFRVINSYGGETDLQKYTLTVSGDRCRIESDFKTVLCDGTTTYTVTGTYRTQLNNTVFTPEYEIGITSLEDVKTAAEKGSVTYSKAPRNDKSLTVTAEDAESGILSEYIVSIETGVVTGEYSYIGGELYRAVVTDSLDVFAADDLPDNYFEIPKGP